MPRFVLFTLLLVLVGCESGTYIDAANIYVAEARQVLIDAKWCQRKIESGVACSTNDLVKFEAGGGVYINVYEVDDASVAQRIIARLQERHKADPNVPVQIRVYASKHGESKRLTAEGKAS